MITPNDALQFIKDHHNGEIPYMFGKNEYARWMAEFANHIVTKHLHKLGVMQAEGSEGEHVCKYCGVSTTQLDDECYAKPSAEGASVGNSAAGQSGSVEKCNCRYPKYNGYTCSNCDLPYY